MANQENAISELCRVCVKCTNVEHDIYESRNREDGLISLHMVMSELFPTIFNVEQTAGDRAMNWPVKVCHDCRRSVMAAYELYELCLSSSDRLRKLYTEQCSAISGDGDVLKVEQVYVSDHVKTEFAGSDCTVEKRPSTPEQRQKTLRRRKTVSHEEWHTKSTKQRLLKGKEHKKHVPKTRRKPQSCIDEALGETDGREGSIGDIPLVEAADGKPTRRKRRTFRQTADGKTTEAYDSTENDRDQTDEPQSKIDVYRCQLCDGPMYMSPLELTDHLKAVHPDQIRSCEQCPKVFMSEQTFQHHQYCHATKRSHFCTFCDKGFQTPDLLKSHIRTHTHRADFLCSLCGKEFNNKSNLRQHVRRHTGDKPWACSQCPGRFTTKGGLTSHQQTHTKVKAFSCDTCGSQFNKHYSLIKHQLIHTGTRPYSCEVCAMRFTSTYHVKRHMRTHTGEKPFKCTYCERSFAQSNDMVKHMRMHVGDNPYQCDRCDASYRLLSDLRNHYKAHYQSGERPPTASALEDDKGIRFTSTDILKLRYRKEMAQSSADGYDGNTDERKALTEGTEFLSIP